MTTPFSSQIVPPQADASEISRKAMQSTLSGLNGLGKSQASPEQKAKKLREACEGFESIFIQKMWEDMRKTLPKSTLLHGREEQFWQGMYDQELAKKMTSVGGIGLADMMYAQLSRNLGDRSRQTASYTAASQGIGFVPEAASVLPSTQPALAASAASASGEREPAAPQAAGQTPTASMPQASVPPTAAPAAMPQNGTVSTASIYEGEAPASAQAVAMPQDQAAPVPQAAQPPASTPAQTLPSAPPVAVAPRPQDIMNSGLTQARLTQFEAGSKLGPGAVRPPMRQLAGLGQTSHSAVTATPPPAVPIAPLTAASTAPFTQAAAPHAAPVTNTAPVSAQPTAGQSPTPAGTTAPVTSQEAQTAPAATPAGDASATVTPQAPTRVRFTTNIPPNSRQKQKSPMIRVLNAEAAGPNSKAGAGIAAYHAQQQAGMVTPQGSSASSAPSATAAPAPLTAQQAASGAPQQATSAPAAPGTATAATAPAQGTASAQAQAATPQAIAMPSQATVAPQPQAAVIPAAPLTGTTVAAFLDGPAAYGVEVPAALGARPAAVRQESRKNTPASPSAHATGIPPLTAAR